MGNEQSRWLPGDARGYRPNVENSKGGESQDKS